MQVSNQNTDNYKLLISKLDQFIRKYYKNLMIKGAILAAFLLLISFLIVSLLEYFGHFSILIRTILFYSYVLLNGIIVSYYFIVPLLKLYRFGKTLTHAQASQIIGQFFPNIQDKLLNTLQLKEMADHNPENRIIIEASINQRINDLRPIPFSIVINMRENLRYLRYLAAPLILIMMVMLIGSPAVITESTGRILNHNTYFEKPMPFEFIIENDSLTSIRGEDFKLLLKLEGQKLPNKVYVAIKGEDYLMRKISHNTYQYIFPKVRKAHTFYFRAGEYNSRSYKLRILPKAVLLGFDLYLTYPAYIGKANEKLENRGDVTVPEGTKIKWHFHTDETKSVFMRFLDTTLVLKQSSRNRFECSRTFRKSNSYILTVRNESMQNPDSVQYYINTIPDAWPRISLSRQEDSINKRFLFFMGEISDDYGLSRLAFRYKFTNSEDTGRIDKIYSTEVPISKGGIYQAYMYSFDLNEIFAPIFSA